MTPSRDTRQRRAGEVDAVAAFLSGAIRPAIGHQIGVTTLHTQFCGSGLLAHSITVSRFSRIVGSLGYQRRRNATGTLIQDYEVTR